MIMEEQLSRWIKITIFLAGLAAFFYFLFTVGDLVRLIVISGLLAYIFDPVVTKFESYGTSRAVATVIFAVIFLAIIGAIFVTIIPLITREISNLSEGIQPEKAQLLIAQLQTAINDVLNMFGVQDVSVTNRIANALVQFGSSLFADLFGVLSVFTNLLLIPFMTFFLVKDGRSIKKHLISLVPNRYFEPTCNLLYKMDLQLGNYFRGQMFSIVIISSLAAFGLWVIGVPYSLFVGVFAGIANVIPYVGPICGALAAIIISLVEGGGSDQLMYVFIVFGLVQLFDNVFVQPNVMARNISLPPLVLLFAVIIGGKFFGILGMLLSVPFTAIAKVTFEEGLKVYRTYRFS